MCDRRACGTAQRPGERWIQTRTRAKQATHTRQREPPDDSERGGHGLVRARPGRERDKGTVYGVETVYVGNHYEVQGGTMRGARPCAPTAGAQRVAMREKVGDNPATLYFLLTDHLGSTAITANGATGAWVGEVRYKAWGEERPACGSPPCGTTPTTYRYTGQRWEAGLGLYFYNARWYDPALGRFVQADTVQPNPGDPQQLNRFSYARDNPLRYRDPSGHRIIDEPDDPTGNRTLAKARVDRAHQVLTALPNGQGTIALTQGFGNTKFAYDQYTGEGSYRQLAYLHSGLDFQMDAGSSVVAVCSGTVVGIDANMGIGGRSVAIRCGNEHVVHGHVIAAPGIEVGTAVRAGDTIGTLQDQGANSHFHLESRDAGNLNVFHNPLYLFTPGVLAKITGLNDQEYVSPASGEVDPSYNVWTMGAYDRGAWNGEMYGNFWVGTATATWGRWW